MPLVVESIHTPRIPVELNDLCLSDYWHQSPDTLARAPVHHGNQQVEFGDFFRVRGSAGDDRQLIWEADCPFVKWLGAGLRDGLVRIDGSVGMHAGAQMIGGELHIKGSADDWLGAEMRGGRIHVTENASDLVGAAYRGSRRGMRGGEILIHGDAGNEVGHTMRRGLIAVAGCCRHAVGTRMIAGCIIAGGSDGEATGLDMKRGSIIFLSREQAPPLPTTFASAGTWTPEYLRLTARHLQSRHWPGADHLVIGPYERFIGDCLTIGKGEVLIPATRSPSRLN